MTPGWRRPLHRDDPRRGRRTPDPLSDRGHQRDRTSRFPRIDDTVIYQGRRRGERHHQRHPGPRMVHRRRRLQRVHHNPTADIDRPAVLAYNGTVYRQRSREHPGEGHADRAQAQLEVRDAAQPRPRLPRLLVEPVDEFAMQADFSDHSHGRPLWSWDSYATAGVVNTQVFPVRTQRNAAFQGLYTYLDLFDGTWRDREGYSNDQFFKAGHGRFDATRPSRGTVREEEPRRRRLRGHPRVPQRCRPHRAAQRNFLLANADIPEMINYAAVTAIVQHVDSQTKNFYMSQDAVTGRWEIIPWDLDHTFGNDCCCGVTSTFVTPAEPADQTERAHASARSPCPEWRQMYFRRLRTLVNRSSPPGGSRPSMTPTIGPAQPEAALDFARLAARCREDLREPADRTCSTRSPRSRSCSPTTLGSPGSRALLPTSSSTRSNTRRREGTLLSSSSSTTRRPRRPSTSPDGRSPTRSTCRSSRERRSCPRARWCSSPTTRRSGARTAPACSSAASTAAISPAARPSRSCE